MTRRAHARDEGPHPKKVSSIQHKHRTKARAFHVKINIQDISKTEPRNLTSYSAAQGLSETRLRHGCGSSLLMLLHVNTVSNFLTTSTERRYHYRARRDRSFFPYIFFFFSLPSGFVIKERIGIETHGYSNNAIVHKYRAGVIPNRNRAHGSTALPLYTL